MSGAGLALGVVLRSRGGDEGAAFEGCDSGGGDVWHFRGAPGKGEVFPEGEEWVAFPHEDALEIWVICEGDTHHIPDFALVPICGFPEMDGGGDGFLFRYFGLEAEVAFVI